MQSPNGRDVEHASTLTLSPPGHSLTGDEAVLIGMAILCRCRLQRVSGVRPVASRVRLASADPVDGGPGPPGLGQCMSDPERGEGLNLGYVGREIQERPEGVISTSGLELPRHLRDATNMGPIEGLLIRRKPPYAPCEVHASMRN